MPATERVFKIADDSFAVITWENPELDLGSLDLPTRVGKQFRPTPGFAPFVMDPAFELVVFRLRDEDGEVSYKGILRDDPLGEAQSAMSDYGAADTGAWVIEVRRNGEWVMEVG